VPFFGVIWPLHFTEYSSQTTEPFNAHW
jgi:hypothetical protein